MRALESVRALATTLTRGAWLRFWLALIGLSLAFVLALLSTAFREEGKLLATAVSGSLSLLIAGLVAITIVPYLARRAALERVRHVIDYDVTREGVAYLLIVLVITIAALNTGNNLLFIVVSAMLAAIVISGVASAVQLRGLQLEVLTPAHVFAGREVPARMVLRNLRRYLPAFSVSVTPPKRATGKVWVLQRGQFRWPQKKAHGQEWVRLPDYSVRLVDRGPAAEPVFRHPVYFPYLPADSSQQAEVMLRFARRGRYAQESFGLATRFPFSFLVKTRRMELRRELIVYPPIGTTDELFEILPMIAGEFEMYVSGRGNDLYRIREHQAGDDARHVDWKATARTGELKVREFTREDERKLRIVFDNPAPGQITEAEYERGVALAASVGWHFADGAAEMYFTTPDGNSREVHDFLRYLALAQPLAGRSVIEDLPATGHFNIIFTARPRGSFHTELWASSYVVYLESTSGPESASK